MDVLPVTPAPGVQRGIALGIEIASVVLFLWAWRDVGRNSPLRAPRRGSGQARALITCAVYGWILEAANIAIFRSYYYPEELYALRVGTVPLYIPLLWAVILHSSMAISDRWAIARWARPFADGLLALLIDLAIDAIAIRLNLWRWRLPSEGFRFMRGDEGWFGVPPGNLMAWMWVACSYSYFRRSVDALASRNQRINGSTDQPITASATCRMRGWSCWGEIAVVLLSYLGLFAGLAVSGLARRASGMSEADQTARLWLFGGQVLLFALVIAWGRANRQSETASREPVPRSFRAGRWAMHGSFAILLVVTGVWRDAPALIAVSAGTMLAEGLAARRKEK